MEFWSEYWPEIWDLNILSKGPTQLAWDCESFSIPDAWLCLLFPFGAIGAPCQPLAAQTWCKWKRSPLGLARPHVGLAGAPTTKCFIFWHRWPARSCAGDRDLAGASRNPCTPSPIS